MLAQLFFFVILLCILTCYFVYQRSKYDYVKSKIDNKYYYVRNLKDKQKTADDLALIRGNILKLVDYMMKNSPEQYKKYIERLNRRTNDVVITENFSEYLYTSYSVNKGDKLVFCLRSRGKTTKNKIHDMNLLMYVVLHEIAHIASPVYGHEQPFRDIFAYFMKSAEELGIYKQIDFQQEPKEYCGMVIHNE